jgi:hypothetical protein
MKTAVEWLVDELYKQGISLYTPELIEKAKEMEKEQIINAFGVGCQVESTRLIGYHDMADEYYNETFKQQEQCKCGQPKVGGYSCQRTDCNQNL